MKISQLLESEKTVTNPFSEPLWHGTNLGPGEYDFKTRAKSRDTFSPIHNMVSEGSKKKLGIDVRSLMFANFEIGEAEQYGAPLILVPLGNDYRLFYAHGIVDMTFFYKFNRRRVIEDIITLIRQTIKKPLEPSRYDEVASIVKQYHQNFNGDINQFFDEFIEKIIPMFEEFEDESMKKSIIGQFRLYASQTVEDVTDYIDRLKEVRNIDDVSGTDFEIMVYAPSGFKLVHEDDE